MGKERLSTSGAGASHSIWNKITNQAEDVEPKKEVAEPNLLVQQADEKARIIFDLAKTHQVTTKPGACKKCGQIGHLTYQCMNLISDRFKIDDFNAEKQQEELAKFQKETKERLLREREIAGEQKKSKKDKKKKKSKDDKKQKKDSKKKDKKVDKVDKKISKDKKKSRKHSLSSSSSSSDSEQSEEDSRRRSRSRSDDSDSRRKQSSKHNKKSHRKDDRR